ncbi:hypothetical protein HanXRQr2_Chr17g0830351 [Helianthus annuus]|uniref:Mitochondrial splicing suppressor 51-like C-terminal domain-containing protein n=1 Tax=Helianthus annuus TaxID=4232 RepID=A0A9K3GVU4_HELAN|nr:hypothetical protein HanXRQr2_Chr17g0830351 [Helianthus annuus]
MRIKANCTLHFLSLVNRDGETVGLYSYAQCTEANCCCKTPKTEFSSHTNTDTSSKITLRFHSGHYHDRYEELTKEFLPDLIIAPNAGIAAYKSWLPTIVCLFTIHHIFLTDSECV